MERLLLYFWYNMMEKPLALWKYNWIISIKCHENKSVLINPKLVEANHICVEIYSLSSFLKFFSGWL